jgi:hypothetical protein
VFCNSIKTIDPFLLHFNTQNCLIFKPLEKFGVFTPFVTVNSKKILNAILMLRNKFLFSPLQMGSGYSGSVVVSSTAFQSQTSAAPHLQSGELKLKT